VAERIVPDLHGFEADELAPIGDRNITNLNAITSGNARSVGPTLIDNVRL
jgi:hypothetical protein